MGSMFFWLHRLLQPHCLECQQADLEAKVCQSCEILKMQLSLVNDEKRQLLNYLIALAKSPENLPVPAAIDYEKVKPKMMTWNVRRQMLEEEDRKSAQILAEQKKRQESIDKLEEEVGIEKEGA